MANEQGSNAGSLPRVDRTAGKRDDVAVEKIAKTLASSIRPVTETSVNVVRTVADTAKGHLQTIASVMTATINEELGVVAQVAAAGYDIAKNSIVAGVTELFGKRDSGEETVEEVRALRSEDEKQTGILSKMADGIRSLTMFMMDDQVDLMNDLRDAVEKSGAREDAVAAESPKKRNKLFDTLLAPVVAAIGLAAGVLVGFVGQVAKETAAVWRGIKRAIGLGKLFSKLGTRVTELFEAMGGPIAKAVAVVRESNAVRFVAKYVKALFSGIGRLIRPVVSAAKWIAESPVARAAFKFGGRVGKFLGKLFYPVTVILSIVDAVSGWMKANKIFGDSATIVQKIESAVAGLVSGLTFGLIDTETIARFIDDARVKISEGVVAAIEKVKAAFVAVGEFFSHPVETLRGVAAVVAEKIGSVTSKVADAVGSVVSAVSEKVAASVETAKTAAAAAIDGVVGFMKSVGSAVSGAVSAAANVAADWANSAVELVKGLVEDYVARPFRVVVSAFGVAVADMLGGVGKLLPGFVGDKVEEYAEGLREKFTVKAEATPPSETDVASRAASASAGAEDAKRSAELKTMMEAAKSSAPQQPTNVVIQQTNNAGAVFASGYTSRNPAMMQPAFVR